MIFVRPLRHERIGGSGLYCELSVIITHLGCDSVVCLDNHMQWLSRLYVLIFPTKNVAFYDAETIAVPIQPS